MRTVELFSGIGGFRLATDQLGRRTVFANDICPRACAVYRGRFGTGELHEGDLRLVQVHVPPHDVLTAGFPCQPFSSAGKKKGLLDPRGNLFLLVADVLARLQPPYFVLENVKRLLHMERGRHFAAMLRVLVDRGYAVEWRLLNALHFGLPQNRERVFLVGTRDSGPTPRSRLASPQDLGVLSGDEVALWGESDDWPPLSKHKARFPNWGFARQGRFFGSDLVSFSNQVPPVLLRSILQEEVPAEFDFTSSTLARLKDSALVNRFVHGVEILSNQGGGARMGYTVFGVNGVAPTLTATTSRHYERYKVGSRYRRLTNVEYARIQGFPDNHCDGVSVYDQYALFGNAVPPPVARWVLAQLDQPGACPADVPVNGEADLFAYARLQGK